MTLLSQVRSGLLSKAQQQRGSGRLLFQSRKEHLDLGMKTHRRQRVQQLCKLSARTHSQLSIAVNLG
jgi:hypothetical protein